MVIVDSSNSHAFRVSFIYLFYCYYSLLVERTCSEKKNSFPVFVRVSQNPAVKISFEERKTRERDMRAASSVGRQGTLLAGRTLIALSHGFSSK